MAKEAVKDGASEFEVAIPSSIFKDRSISVLEAIVEYLKDVQRMRYSDIAQLLNRDERTVWTCYDRVRKKRGGGK